MKKALLLLACWACLWLAPKAYAQATLHSLVLIDKQDAATLNGRLQNQERILLELDTIARMAVLKHQPHTLPDNEFTREGLERAIAALPLQADDVVFFYFSGQEYIGRTAGRSSHQLKMGDSFIDLAQVYGSLKGKVKLCLAFADLCNQAQSGPEAYTWQAAEPLKYDVLFAQSSGALLAVNHVPREQAGLAVAENGSIFTQCLIQALHARQDDKSWAATVDELKLLAIKRSGGMLNPQVKLEIVVSQNRSDRAATAGNTNRTPTNNSNPQPSYRPQRSPRPNPQDNPPPARQAAAEEATEEAAPVVSAQEMAKTEGGKAMGKFQEQLQQLTSGTAPNDEALIEEIMRLFTAENKRLEVSHLGGNQMRTATRTYLQRLANMRKRYTIAVSYYQPTEIVELTQQNDSTWQGTARIFQEFRKTNRAGRLVYGDRTIKRVELLIKALPEGQWSVNLGHIAVEPNSTQPLGRTD